jgi:hypothetical protein
MSSAYADDHATSTYADAVAGITVSDALAHAQLRFGYATPWVPAAYRAAAVSTAETGKVHFRHHVSPLCGTDVPEGRGVRFAGLRRAHADAALEVLVGGHPAFVHVSAGGGWAWATPELILTRPQEHVNVIRRRRPLRRYRREEN